MKVIIAGSRSFTDAELLFKVCDTFLAPYTHIEIVSGTARGADQLGEYYARHKGYPLIRFYPKWEENGKAAGPIRNREMAEYADALIAFWDGQSKGTKNMIEEATKRNLKILVVKFEP